VINGAGESCQNRKKIKEKKQQNEKRRLYLLHDATKNGD